jgi:hypothetical protein
MNNKQVTLRQLVEFQPLNDREKEIYNINQEILDNMKLKLEKDIYFLGGQLKMGYDDEITIESFNIVRVIDTEREFEYRGPCNSWEAMSISNHRTQFFETEKMFYKYYEIIKLRESTK